jgi:hypothetical protein
VRLIVARVLVVAGVLLGVVSIYANFVKREALDEKAFRGTSSALIANGTIRDQVAVTAVDLLYQNVDVAAELEAQLPENLRGLAGPIAGATRELANRAAVEALSRPAVQSLFVESSTLAQQRVVDVLEGNTGVLATTGGKVVLDLRPIVIALGDRFEVIGNLADRVPQDAARLTILESDQLKTAQDLTQLLKVVANWIWVPMVALWALAVWLVRGRRRLELRAIAIGWVVVGIAVLALRGIFVGYLADHLAASDSVRPAVNAFWSILTHSLVAAGWTVLATGLVATSALWLAGPARPASAARRWLAPYLRRPDIAWVSFAVLFLLFLWILPSSGWIYLLIIVSLAIVGFELLCRQTARDFPDAQPTELLASWQGWRKGRSEAVRTTPAPTSTAGELERLAALHAGGVLTAEEFAVAKAKALGSG